MKLISLAVAISIFAMALPAGSVAQTNKNVPVHKADSSTFKFLRKYDKKYPNEVRLLDNAILKPRLKTLLGAKFAVLKAKWALEIPIEIKNDLFISYACQEHNCDMTNFMIIVDIKRDIMYVGFREEQKVQVFAEDGTNGPVELQEWATKKSE